MIKVVRRDSNGQEVCDFYAEGCRSETGWTPGELIVLKQVEFKGTRVKGRLFKKEVEEVSTHNIAIARYAKGEWIYCTHQE